MLACRHVSTRSMLTRRPAPADQTTGAAPSGVHRRVCTPGLLVMKQLAETCVSGWQENNLRTFGVPAPCVCVSEWLPVCVWVSPCYANRPPPFQISVFICSRVHEPLPPAHSTAVFSPAGSVDILGFSVIVSSVFRLGFFFLVFSSVVYFFTMLTHFCFGTNWDWCVLNRQTWGVSEVFSVFLVHMWP